MTTLIARQNETLDALLYRTTGGTAGIEALLAANPGVLASATLTRGTRITLPEALATTQAAVITAPSVTLWE